MSHFRIDVSCGECGSYDVALTPKILKNNVPQLQGHCQQCGLKKFIPQNQPTTHWYMPFGKYRGLTLRQIKENDPDYFEWAVNNLPTNVNEKFKRFNSEIQGS